MKKTAIVLFFLLAISMLPGTAVAQSDGEYEAALKSYYSGKYKDAVRHLNGYIAQKPDPAAYYLMGYSLYKLKRFDEANEYFRDAYLLDPAFTPMKVDPEQEIAAKPVKKAVKAKKGPAAEAVPADSGQKPSEVKKPEPARAETTAVPAPKTEPAKPGPPKVEPQKPEPQKPEAPKPEPPGTVSPATPQVPAPQPAQPPVPMPQLPKPKQTVPEGMGGLIAIPMLMGGLFAGFALVFLGIALAFYIFFSLCMYLIAKKLNVPAAWTAWVPLLNLWAFVGSAGKPWWWIIILISPVLGGVFTFVSPAVGGVVSMITSLVSLVVWLYLWMCITENLGKNKWLGLLMILPLINMIFMAVLAFSKETAPARPTEELE